MIVKKIDIENYKGFEKQEITFNDNLNVFIGANASGKTSILEAIVKCLYRLTRQFVQISTPYLEPTILSQDRSLLLNRSEIRHHNLYAKIKTFLDVSEYGNLEIGMYAGSLDESQKKERKVYENNLVLFTNFFDSKISDAPFTIPIIKYYPADKGRVKFLTLSSDEKLYRYPIPQLEAWVNVFQNDYSYSNFLEWFFEYETQELRLQRDTNDFNLESNYLKYVRYAVERALHAIYDKSYTIKSDGKSRGGTSKLTPTLLLKVKDKDHLPAEDLELKSSGEKSIITLVADIAYNLALAHDFESDENYLNSPGIVLIDEIEEHLHPNWQRKIIPILTSVFPKIQFFITTHSPQVISSVNSKHVFLCEDFVVDKVHLRTKGVDSNALLTFLFNSTERPKEYIDLINKFDELVENEADTSELERIIEKVSKLEEEDTGSNISGLVGELGIKLAAYKFDLEHEMD